MSLCLLHFHLRLPSNYRPQEPLHLMTNLLRFKILKIFLHELNEISVLNFRVWLGKTMKLDDLRSILAIDTGQWNMLQNIKSITAVPNSKSFLYRVFIIIHIIIFVSKSSFFGHFCLDHSKLEVVFQNFWTNFDGWWPQISMEMWASIAQKITSDISSI